MSVLKDILKVRGFVSSLVSDMCMCVCLFFCSCVFCIALLSPCLQNRFLALGSLCIYFGTSVRDILTECIYLDIFFFIHIFSSLTPCRKEGGLYTRSNVGSTGEPWAALITISARLSNSTLHTTAKGEKQATDSSVSSKIRAVDSELLPGI